jgi:hypothetical protein
MNKIRITESELIKLIIETINEETYLINEKSEGRLVFPDDAKFAKIKSPTNNVTSYEPKVKPEGNKQKIETPNDYRPQPPSVKGSANEAIRFLIGKGLSKSQAAGVAGNLHHESGFNPTVKPGDGGTSFGIAQWHNERGVKMKNWTKKNGHNPNTFKGQMEYLWWELQNDERNALMKLKKTNNPKDAAFTFARYFERCTVCKYRNKIMGRLRKAQEFYDNY